VILKSWTGRAVSFLAISAHSAGVGTFFGGGAAASNRSRARRRFIACCSSDGVGMTGSLDGTAHGTIGRFRYSSRRPSLVFLRRDSLIGPVHGAISPFRWAWCRFRFCSGLILMKEKEPCLGAPLKWSVERKEKNG
jgi:hypothetical protein